MSMVWDPGHLPPVRKLGLRDKLRALVKGITLAVLLIVGVCLLIVIRLIEWPIFGHRRRFAPHLVQTVCRISLRIIGIRLETEGTPLNGQGAVVANHTGWMDIFVLNARKRVYFVSKDEVASWPGIGQMAKLVGTVFIKRDPREAQAQIELFRERLSYGHRLLFFPEGTSTDGRRVLPFKPTLFAAFMAPELKPTLSIQPVSVIYRGAPTADPRQYGWWGDMSFGEHLVQVLAAPEHGSVTVVYHPPVHVADYDRKTLAKALEETIRAPMAEAGVLDD